MSMIIIAHVILDDSNEEEEEEEDANANDYARTWLNSNWTDIHIFSSQSELQWMGKYQLCLQKNEDFIKTFYTMILKKGKSNV